MQSPGSPFTFESRVEDHKLMQLACSWSRLSRKLASAKCGKGNCNKVITNSFRYYILYQKAGLLNYFQEFLLAYLLNFFGKLFHRARKQRRIHFCFFYFGLFCSSIVRIFDFFLNPPCLLYRERLDIFHKHWNPAR